MRGGWLGSVFGPRNRRQARGFYQRAVEVAGQVGAALYDASQGIDDAGQCIAAPPATTAIPGFS